MSTATRTTASIVATVFNNDGQFFRLDDGRKLGDVAAEYGGVIYKTTDRDDTVIVFPDGSAIGCTVLGWDVVHHDADLDVYRSSGGDWTFILA